MSDLTFDGKCSCGELRYQLTSRPMIVHCCHCTWCQRETGSAFVINAMIETDRMTVDGNIEVIETPSESGGGQLISRCVNCKIAIWSNYPGGGEKIRFVRTGTLLNPNLLPPHIHIYTSTKQPWLNLPKNVPSFDEYYDRKDYWPQESLLRLAILFGLDDR